MPASFSQPALNPKNRENRGLKTRDYKALVPDGDLRRALKLSWIFFCRYDKSVFGLNLNHRSWPQAWGFYDKMNINKRTAINMKTEIGLHDCQFVEMCLERDYKVRSLRALDIINEAKMRNESIAEITLSLEEENDENIPSERSVGDLFEKDLANSQNDLTSTQKKKTKAVTEVPQNSTAKRFVAEPVVQLGVEESIERVREKNGDIALEENSKESEKINESLLSGIREIVENQKKYMEEMAANQKRLHDQMLKIRKAEKREFLNILAVHLKVDTSDQQEPCNSSSDPSLPPLIYKGFDLMSIYASEKSSIFGRELARRLFGHGKQCELIRLIIGKQTTRESCRIPCDKERFKLFKECVTRKYPRAPEAAFASARDAANQYGLDQKGKHGMEFINEMMTQPRVQDTDDEQESE